MAEIILKKNALFQTGVPNMSLKDMGLLYGLQLKILKTWEHRQPKNKKIKNPTLPYCRNLNE